ncbi:MFS transporter [Candidatus Synechococcus calcipolaris G9]|uniref:MFS transporter n=1 Tax=Candidatus Synechococcus calcipolaris G9 TaxID=1497997 RepID=A0ABT6EWG3_9SYNE|nr:MFS transporter [Candidatus Synechococcus calcipolaris]MDG2989707.1 MFS transporter [Candidatus Synechococcus calcipolaris G9]
MTTSKSLQAHIDETPPRPLSSMQWRIWLLAAMGKFFEGMIIFITGVALPLIERDFNLPSDLKGTVAAATLFGILIGASLFGNLADRLGRRYVFVLEMGLFTLFVGLTAISWNIQVLIFFLFCVGVCLGADYPTAHIVVSESIPSKFRGRMVLGAFAFQSVGSLGGVLLGLATLKAYPQVGAWHWMYGVLVIPGLVVFLMRTTLAESAHWLLSRDRPEAAHRSAHKLLQRPVDILPSPKGENTSKHRRGFRVLFTPRYLRATILAAVPWFIQDLSTYGIGIFTPTILATLFTRTNSNFIFQDMAAAEGSGAIDLFLLFGFLASIPLVDRIGRIPLQIIGFIGCAVGLLIASLSAGIPEGHELKVMLIFAGFMIFNFMTNFGPNAMTYVLAGEVFPTEIRGVGAGFAASFAKVGAVLTAFFFPILRKDIGTANLLYGLAATAIIGAIVTYLFRIEPKGQNLEALEE